MNLNTRALSARAKLGFHALALPSKSTLPFTACEKNLRRFDRHPLGIDLPGVCFRNLKPEVIFGGTSTVVENVETFLAALREWSMIYPAWVTKNIYSLRSVATNVANLPKSSPNRWLFAEVWVGDRLLVSGETNNFTPEGGASYVVLENVLWFLSEITGLEIESIDVSSVAPFDVLYGKGIRIA